VDWLYDMNGNWQGTLNMTQTNKVSKDGNDYSGTFDAKFYDTSGNLTNEITGTSSAERLNWRTRTKTCVVRLRPL
jgi:hypothetical protein